MCRSIKRLNLQEHHATNEEIEAAALQFVRKVSGMRQPSQKNKAAFDTAVAEVSHDISHLLVALVSVKRSS